MVLDFKYNVIKTNAAYCYFRANSIQNVAYNSCTPVTRRSSEREMGDSSSKKRAISASGLDRNCDGKCRLLIFLPPCHLAVFFFASFLIFLM